MSSSTPLFEVSSSGQLEYFPNWYSHEWKEPCIFIGCLGDSSLRQALWGNSTNTSSTGIYLKETSLLNGIRILWLNIYVTVDELCLLQLSFWICSSILYCHPGPLQDKSSYTFIHEMFIKMIHDDVIPPHWIWMQVLDEDVDNISIEKDKNSITTSESSSWWESAENYSFPATNVVRQFTGFQKEIREKHINAKLILGKEMDCDFVHLLFEKWLTLAQHTVGDCMEWTELKWRLETNTCQAAAKEAIDMYSECIDSAVLEEPPMSERAFRDCHSQMLQIAIDMYRSEIATDSMTRSKVQDTLMKEIKVLYTKAEEVLLTRSVQYCTAQRVSLFKKHSHELKSADTFEVFQARFTSFIQECNIEMKGPGKMNVLQDCWATDAVEALAMYQDTVMERTHGEELSRRKQVLQEEYETKKATLVQHFQMQEQSLRQKIAQEQETFSKLQNVDASRKKAGEADCKRLRTAVENLKTQNQTVQGEVVVLTHQLQETENRRVAVQCENDQLRTTLGNEREAADRVSTAFQDELQTAAEQVKQSDDQLHALQESMKDVHTKYRSELEGNVSHIRTITEERDMLQTRLSDFFLKVTALPKSLQEHFFCDEETRGDFADALTSFMDE